MVLRSMTFKQIGMARGGKSAKDMSSQHSKAVQFMQQCAGGAAGRRKKNMQERRRKSMRSSVFLNINAKCEMQNAK
jgi:hypothetical protein